ncbi:MAG: conjugal transfer protein TraG N-terminal domain-containing protein [Proteobacteria bacterium]|nr:conjugal transfer protein TraG N-terminal domain-containing protein [Pseudomonadota bacterium]
MDCTVYTTGGGEFLVRIFKGMVALVGDGSYTSMLKIVVLFGLIWILLEVTFSGEFKRGIKWFFAMFLAFNIMMVPKVTVIVEDKLNPNLVGHGNIINGVPFAIGMVGHFTSIIGDKATEMMETAYGNDSLTYNKYGMIAPINVADSVTRAKIVDPAFAQTIRHFMKQCVFYDILLKRYSARDLLDQKDLWQYLEDNASKARSFVIYDKKGANQIEWCNEGVIKLRAERRWESEMKTVEKIIGHRLYPHLDQGSVSDTLNKGINSFQGKLFDISQNAQDAIKQAMVINSYKDAMGSFGNNGVNAYAQARSEMQTKMTYEVIRKQAQSWVPILRAVLQGLLYGAFPMVFLLMLLPIGASVAKNYFAMFVWIESWGPIYAIINTMLVSYAGSEYRSESMLFGESGLTLGAHGAIMQVNQNIASVAGNMVMFIPFIAGAMMWGVRSFTSLATSMLATPMQAAQEAAREASTGNISLGNIQAGNASYNNITGNKMNDSVMIDSGRLQTINSGGGISQITSGGQETIDMTGAYSKNPGFETKYFENQSAQMTNAATYSENNGVTSAIQGNQTRAEGTDTFAQAAFNQGKSGSLSDNYSKTMTNDQREALQQYESSINDWSKSNNMSREDTVRLFAKAGTPGSNILGFGAGAEGAKTTGDRQTLDKAQKYMESRNFESNKSIVESMAKSQNYNLTDSEGRNISQSISESYKEASNYDKQSRAYFDTAQSQRKDAQYLQSNGSSIMQDTQQPFVEYMKEQRDGYGQPLAGYRLNQIMTANAYSNPEDYQLRERLYGEFIEKYGDNIMDMHKNNVSNTLSEPGAFDSNPNKGYVKTYKDLKNGWQKLGEEPLENNEDSNVSNVDNNLNTNNNVDNGSNDSNKNTASSKSEGNQNNQPYNVSISKLGGATKNLNNALDQLEINAEQAANNQNNSNNDLVKSDNNQNNINKSPTLKEKGELLISEVNKKQDDVKSEINSTKGNLDKGNIKKEVEEKHDPKSPSNHVLMQMGGSISDSLSSKLGMVMDGGNQNQSQNQLDNKINKTSNKSSDSGVSQIKKMLGLSKEGNQGVEKKNSEDIGKENTNLSPQDGNQNKNKAIKTEDKDG